jgi:hypothetical protein
LVHQINCYVFGGPNLSFLFLVHKIYLNVFWWTKFIFYVVWKMLKNWSTKLNFLCFLVNQFHFHIFWSTKFIWPFFGQPNFFFCKTFYEFFPALIWDGITISQYVIKDKTFKSGTIGNESLKPIMSTLHSQRTLLISPLHKNPTANNLTSSQTPKSFFSKKYSNKAYTT